MMMMMMMMMMARYFYRILLLLVVVAGSTDGGGGGGGAFLGSLRPRPRRRCTTTTTSSFLGINIRRDFFRADTRRTFMTASSVAQSSCNNKAVTEDMIKTVQGPFDVRLLDDDVWGQEPLLIRQAFPEHEQLRQAGTWPSWLDILDLACENDDDDNDDDHASRSKDYGDDNEMRNYNDNDDSNDWADEDEPDNDDDDSSVFFPDDNDTDDNDSSSRFSSDDDDDDDDDDDYDTDNMADDVAVSTGESARLIQHIPGRQDSFTLQLGPFNPFNHENYNNNNNAFSSSTIPNKDHHQKQQQTQQEQQQRAWTLIVNDVDRYLHHSYAAADDDHDDKSTRRSNHHQQQQHQNHHHPVSVSLADWMDATFSFLPRWRRDDAQVSIAPRNGGIGPHVDNYDVFLIQTMGRREWKIALHNVVNNNNNNKNNKTTTTTMARKLSLAQEYDNLVPDLDVRILKGFMEQRGSNDDDDVVVVTVILEPGDVLYVPPRVIHWGTSLSQDGCMTFSVGCRAPSAAELVARMAETIMCSSSGTMDTNPVIQQRYTERRRRRRSLKATTATAETRKTTFLHHDDKSALDDDDDMDGNHHYATRTPSISDNVKNDMKELVVNAMNQVMEDALVWDEIVGKLVTEPKRFLSFQDEATTTTTRTKIVSIEKMLNRMRQQRQFENTMDSDHGGSDGDDYADMKDWSLVRTPGISFATSCVLDEKKNQTIHRLFAHGEMYETWDNNDEKSINSNSSKKSKASSSMTMATAASIILNRIERGQPLELQQHVAQASKSTRELLQNLLDDGYLYVERRPLPDPSPRKYV